MSSQIHRVPRPVGHRGRRIIIVAIAVALVAASCSRDGDTTNSASDDTAAPTTVQTDGSAAAGLDAGAYGTLDTLCSDGDAEPVSGVPGIDGTTVNVGTFADAGFSGLPGLNKEFFDTADAVIKWCNAHGGVRGYQLASNQHDSALTEYAVKMAEACESDFFIVGGGGVLDDTGQPAKLGCGLPEVSAFSVTPAAANADITLSSLPNPVDQLTASEQYYAEQRWPDLLDKTAIITIATPSTLTIRDRYLDYFEGTPWKVVYSAELAPLGEASYAPFIQAMKDKGVEIVSLVATEPTYLSAMQKEAADLEFEPTAWIVSTNIYDQKYIELAGKNAVNTFTRSIFWPVEAADENQATADYLELLRTVDGKTSLLGMHAMSSWLLFLGALGECADQGTVTRDCVFQEGSKQTRWTGGGLHSPLDVTVGSPPGCAAIVEATPVGWVLAPDQELNEDGYNCDPENVAQLSEDYGQGAKCPSGVQDPLPSTCA